MHYLLTFRTYGTWLHGDERGSVDRAHNRVGEPLIGPDARLERFRRSLLETPPVTLDEEACACVEKTICEVAAYRGWTIHAVKAMSNHVHIVVETNENLKEANGDQVLATFKSYATRRLREASLMKREVSPWEHHGSTRYLKSQESIERACQYVRTQCEPRASATGLSEQTGLS